MKPMKRNMTLNYEKETEITPNLGESAEDLARRVILAGLEETRCPFDVQVSLLITDNDNIREMNRSFRQIDAPTDVLSFPLQEFEQPAGCSVFDPESGQLMLGDIVINAQRVISQAEEYGHSQKREYAFLIAHSLLHLVGFDHMEEEERLQMEEHQRRIMEMTGISR